MFATTAPPAQRLLIFARLPELGRVKSRLAATLGAPRALAVYSALLQDVLHAAGASTPETEIEVTWAPVESANGAALRRAFGERSLAMQTGATLGDRLAMAFSERFFFHRAQKIIAIGVDEPRLTRDTIDHAFGLLDSCDWVVGPAADGGYYLIGCRAPVFDAAVFQGIRWGSDEVLAATLEKIREWGQNVASLPARRDIDTEADLRDYAAGCDPRSSLGRLLHEWRLHEDPEQR